jgi:hypothetical protein
MIWLAVVAGAAFLFCSPVIAAALLRRDGMGIVVVLTCLTVFTGVTWFGAWIAVFMLPRKMPALPPRHVRPYVPVQARWDEPRTEQDLASLFLGDYAGAGPLGRS